MEKQIIVHFGAGALGRGLVIPLLVESGCEVVIVDTNETLNDVLNRDHSYEVCMTDDPQRHIIDIPIRAALSPAKDAVQIEKYLLASKTVTTSVRRENLNHVARTLADVWGSHPDGERRVILCENIELVGKYFTSLLYNAAQDVEQREVLRSVVVPDTIVDRICSADWPRTSCVTTEIFHELAVDANVLPDTCIRLIPSVGNISAAFARKRFLVNTYADASSVFALADGCHYLCDAVNNRSINDRIRPYMELLKRLLVIQYGYQPKELDEWEQIYKRRLANPEIPRDLRTVARGLWQKLEPDERFVQPIINLMKHGELVEDGVCFLADLILAVNFVDAQPLGRDGTLKRLKMLWETNMECAKLFEMVKERLLSE